MRQLATSIALILALTGCSASESPAPSDQLSIVASTNVWADIAQSIGGERVQVKAIINRIGADPHSYEASARDRLAIDQADLLIANGGGYDDFMEQLAAGKEILYAVPQGSQLTNEHVWYDTNRVAAFAGEIAKALSALKPESKTEFETNLENFNAELKSLEGEIEAAKKILASKKYLASEPLAGYLLAAVGLVDQTPASFADAIEEERDVAPKDLLEVENLLAERQVAVFVINSQTGSSQIDELVAVAKSNQIPVVELSELLPENFNFLSWMSSNVARIVEALS